jgi:hypothetical protein
MVEGWNWIGLEASNRGDLFWVFVLFPFAWVAFSFGTLVGGVWVMVFLEY